MMFAAMPMQSTLLWWLLVAGGAFANGSQSSFSFYASNSVCTAASRLEPNPACRRCKRSECEEICRRKPECTHYSHNPFRKGGYCLTYAGCELSEALSSFYSTFKKLPADTCSAEGCDSIDGSMATSIDGVSVLIPEDVLGVLSSPRPANLSDACCWKSMDVMLDKEERPILISLDDFLCGVDDIVALATKPPAGLEWQASDIHKHDKIQDPVEAQLKGNGFPGLRIHLNKHKYGRMVTECLAPAIKAVWPDFDMWSTALTQHAVSIISAAHQPRGTWLDAQRNPHNDIKWEYGILQPSKVVPPCLATVFGLTSLFNESGTSIFRTKRTTEDSNERLSLLETLPQNERAQGVFSGRVDHRVPDLDVRKEIPDPCPQAVTSSPWAEAIVVAKLKYNRLTVYDGRRLHNQYATPEACARFSTDPTTGRMTMNSFYWHSTQTYGQKSKR
mmetsp:Transcript_65131/g.121394  ORF Transcript_65131/g.121394 Transcript_65131/m.121394 type:complete len:446 (+) Transcript_65131:85-1422(+)